ncbi:TonB-dependent receptor [Cupriavidus basilensis]|uniref:TonB-dependent receptor n=1 Tax=Cupriavidus basilensis TaxID=68895 RepID=A0ABT6AV41_9BURK|nr:TonB-dependent receptor [Cupriavidus basilensis]MDF3836448.1 TonB-dependent receptor [Cupriavidus basilensis]
MSASHRAAALTDPARQPKPAVGWLRCVMACLAFGASVPVLPAHAQSPAAPGAIQARVFAIAPGPLTVTLNRFARAAGINLSYDAALLGDAQGPGLHGSHTVAQGLGALLAGSGLEAVALPGGGFAVRRAPPAARGEAAGWLPAVTVTGVAASPGELPQPFAGEQVARGARLGMLGDVDVMDAPFHVTGYTAKAIADQQARTVGDVLANDASVRFVSLPGGILDAFTIRGFPVGNGNFGEIAFDGAYGVASNYRVSTAYVERIELIRGPTALLNGMAPSGSVGGGINIVPKRATGPDLTQVTVDYASASQLGGNLDLSRRFGAARQFGIRFNGSHRGGGTGVDNQSRNAGAGALALDYQGERLRATADFIDQQERINAPSRLPHIVSGIAVPAAPDGRRNIIQSWETSRIRDQSLLLRAEYDLGDGLTWFADAGGGRTRVARLFAITPLIVDAAGDVSVSDSNYRFNVDRATADTGLRARFDTGAVGHSLTVHLSAYRDALGRGVNASTTTLLTNLYQPVALAEQSLASPAGTPRASESTLTGVALADTLSMLDKRVQLTLGVRHQRVRSDNFSAAGAAASRYDRSALTPMLGLVVRPWPQVSLYANRVEGLSKGDSAPSSAGNAGEVFAPYKATQYETGVKLEHGRLMATLSAFQITKPGGQMTGTLFAADGEQRNRGLELGLSGEATPGLRLLASATMLDARLTRSSDPGTAGKTAIGVPSFQANLGAEWDTPFVPALTLAGSLVHTGKQYVDQANRQRIPGWTRVDLGARYRATVAGRPTTFRINVRNVFDQRYWAAVDAYGGLAQAEPRTFMLSATVSF